MMTKLSIFLLFLISFTIYAEEMTVEKFKEIMKGKETKTIRKELQPIFILKKCTIKIKFSYPDRDDFTGTATGSEKYIDEKYILSTAVIPDGPTLYFIKLWDEKDKVITTWNLNQENQLTKGVIKPTKKEGRFIVEGNFPNDTNYKGYADYSEKLNSWEGKYTDKNGKLLFSESGTAVLVE